MIANSFFETHAKELMEAVATIEPPSGLADTQHKVVKLAIAELGYSDRCDPIRTWESISRQYDRFLAASKKKLKISP